MIKEMKGWKVLKKCSRTSTTYSVYAIGYPTNVEVHPYIKGSKLFFFKDLRDANRFRLDTVGGMDYCIVVPCIAYNVTKPKWMCFFTSDYKQFWNSKNRSKLKTITFVVKGTFFAESIKCLA